MRNYASFGGNWPVVPDSFESLRSLLYSELRFGHGFSGQSNCWPVGTRKPAEP